MNKIDIGSDKRSNNLQHHICFETVTRSKIVSKYGP